MTSDFFRPRNMSSVVDYPTATVTRSFSDVTATQTTDHNQGSSGSYPPSSKVTRSTTVEAVRYHEARDSEEESTTTTEMYSFEPDEEHSSQDHSGSTPKVTTKRVLYYGTHFASLERCSQDLLSLRHRLKRFYETKKVNATSVQMLCLPNFHWVAGSTFAHCLRNGSWTGTETVCEVDYFKHRLRLSIIIVLTCVVISGSFLCADFYCFINRRSELRVEKTRIRYFDNRRDFELGYNKRCMAYPIFGLSDLKLYLPEINQFVDIKPRSEYREMQERLQEEVWSYAQNQKSKGAEYERQLQSYRAALLTRQETLSNLALADNVHDGQSATFDHEQRSQSHHDSKVDNVQFEDDKDFGFAYIPPKKATADSRKKTNYSRGLLLFRLRARTYSRKDPADKGYDSA